MSRDEYYLLHHVASCDRSDGTSGIEDDGSDCENLMWILSWTSHCWESLVMAGEMVLHPMHVSHT